MAQVATMRHLSWASLAWLLIIVVGAITALALGNIAPLVVLAAVGLLMVLWLLVVLWRALPRSAAARAAETPRAQRSVLMPDGTVRQALVVPAQTAEGYQAVLTIDGYALVNGEGQVVYTLRRPVRDGMGEPVVVTIVGEAIAA